MQRKFKKNEFCNKYASDSPKESIFRIQNAERDRAKAWIITGHTQASFKPFFLSYMGQLDSGFVSLYFGIFGDRI